jgi:hypothetical protein
MCDDDGTRRSAALLSSDSVDAALLDADTCIGVHPKWADGYICYGAARRRQGNHDCIEVYRLASKLFPEHPALVSAWRSAEEAFETGKSFRPVFCVRVVAKRRLRMH